MGGFTESPNDETRSLQPSQHHEAPTDTVSLDWSVTPAPPQPVNKSPDELLRDFQKINFSDEVSLEELTRLKLYAPSVMIPLAENKEIQYYVCFGGSEMTRMPQPMDGITTDDINDIYMATESKPSSDIRLPKFVFEIGQLFIRTADKATGYQPTSYRLVINAENGAVWLFYEYYQLDDEETKQKQKFEMNPTLASRLPQNFDCAIVIDSVQKWDENLTVEMIESSMGRNAFMTHTVFGFMLNTPRADIHETSSGERNQVPSTPGSVPATSLKAKTRLSVKSLDGEAEGRQKRRIFRDFLSGRGSRVLPGVAVSS